MFAAGIKPFMQHLLGRGLNNKTCNPKKKKNNLAYTIQNIYIEVM